MKKTLLVITVMAFSAGLFAQGDLENAGYFRIGYSKPAKTYGGVDETDIWDEFNIKRHGFVMESGRFYYFNSLYLADGLKLGINPDWYSFRWHFLNSKDFEAKDNLIFLGSKVGPVLSYSPLDGMAIDAYGKFNIDWVSILISSAESLDNTELGFGFIGVGYSLGLNFRYNKLILGFEFARTWNKIQHYDADNGFDGDYLGNSSDPDKDHTPIPSWNFTIGFVL